jgi:hypothetical protein
MILEYVIGMFQYESFIFIDLNPRLCLFFSLDVYDYENENVFIFVS